MQNHFNRKPEIEIFPRAHNIGNFLKVHMKLLFTMDFL